MTPSVKLELARGYMQIGVLKNNKEFIFFLNYGLIPSELNEIDRLLYGWTEENEEI